VCERNLECVIRGHIGPFAPVNVAAVSNWSTATFSDASIQASARVSRSYGHRLTIAAEVVLGRWR
jgi:hypothetical protein